MLVHDPMTPGEIASALLAEMEIGWNAGDGDRFAAPFTDDAHFVDIRGGHHVGRSVIASSHTFIFNTIYKGSTVKYEAIDARFVAHGCLLAHGGATLDAPAGPLAGTHHAINTIVAIDVDGAWKITGFHNTLVIEG